MACNCNLDYQSLLRAIADPYLVLKVRMIGSRAELVFILKTASSSGTETSTHLVAEDGYNRDLLWLKNVSTGRLMLTLESGSV